MQNLNKYLTIYFQILKITLRFMGTLFPGMMKNCQSMVPTTPCMPNYGYQEDDIDE